MNNRLGIIGFGNMGSAIAEQIKSKYQVWVFDKEKNKTSGFSYINIAQSIADLISRVDVVVLAVKPQDFDIVLKEARNFVKGKLIISIAAGITTSYIENILGNNIKVVRAMPNIGVKIGSSVTCLCRGRFVNSADFDLAQEIFYYLGTIKEIEEKMMNPSTAISGSGPAYIYDDMELNSIDPYSIPQQKKEDYIKRLARAAEEVGFNSEDAYFLAVNTTNTSISLIKEVKISPAELKKQITSKGGTTEAAIKVLRELGSWDEAARAALARAEELSKKGC